MLNPMYLLLVAAIVVLASVRRIPEGHAYTLRRVGGHTRTVGSGMHIVLPVLERVAHRIRLLGNVVDIDATAARAARDRPPSSPRAENERMKTRSSAAFAPIRTRSPSTAPPVTGLDGSIATTAIVCPSASHAPSNASTSVADGARPSSVMPARS